MLSIVNKTMLANIKHIVSRHQQCWPTGPLRYVVSDTATNSVTESAMNCWQLNAYSKTLNDTTLSLNINCHKPIIQKPTEMLVRVMSSSVNPIDLAMSSGYGRSLLDVLQMTTDYGVDAITYDRLPLILGRDFCGQVVECGHQVVQYKVGDMVWGALPPFWRSGTLSQFIVADQSHLCLKPSNLSVIDSSAIPYVGLTAWAALHTIGGLNQLNARNKRVLILGGSGGVGSFAIQLLKTWGAHVTTTCAADAIDFVVSNTGADECVDYNSNDLIGYLGTFDLVLNAASIGQHRDLKPEFGVKYLRKWKSAKYVTLSTPLLNNTDQFGLIIGSGLSAFTAIKQTMESCIDGHSVRWAYFWPNPCALKTITKLVEKNHIKAIIENKISFSDIPLAFNRLARGHARGKTVIEIE
ncbi:reticulon-4-interacting protein 1 homolog, mitochondrial-like [Oppia nitens]|uniref:reticulon-4-interacting protein 1 homolog, mitochondrial-like n=1 Tax=Oppia nitens TaxID=1686743 RepID=UPI0023DC6316|nr:reticulon-4-interacting protein 1 homolog, mitochondrial-like [Oppia nitens]